MRQQSAHATATQTQSPSRVWRIRLYDGERVADEWHSILEPYHLGKARQFTCMDSGILVTVEGNVVVEKVTREPQPQPLALAVTAAQPEADATAAETTAVDEDTCRLCKRSFADKEPCDRCGVFGGFIGSEY
ncbi:MAG: hypothetical protein ACRD3W_06380 [Terriglobales bacterium]